MLLSSRLMLCVHLEGFFVDGVDFLIVGWRCSNAAEEAG